ncbi:MAG: hypothetical protein K0S32_3809 [Bacteroidetes bacterium]|jgi:hypothetical protein|nr:hypothetical protein [Bacteroidota bacterium]
MSNNSTVKCPNCGHEFEASESIKHELQEKFRKEATEWRAKKEEEFKKKEEAFQKTLSGALEEQKTSLSENIKKSLTSDFENQIKLLSESNKENEEKLKAARLKELEFLKKEQELKNKEAEMEILLQKKLNEERTSLTETIKKQEQERTGLVIREYEMKLEDEKKKLEDQKKLIEEMQRKAEQGSMQLQGEVQELALEELLRTAFPFDTIEEVAKGVKGADCMLHVKNSLAQPCGKIIYESKRTKAFTNEWIEKLKVDMRSQQADIAIIVTETLPKDMTTFGFKDGVWICRFAEVKPLSFVLRDSLIRINTALVTQENKGEKMQMLYSYLTGNEFRQSIEAVMEGFFSLKEGITKEKVQMEKIWKEREKQLEKVLNNTAQFYGSIKGIGGNAIGDIKLLE